MSASKVNRLVERHVKARRFSTVLVSTTERYLDGYMARATWDRHMRALWRQIDAEKLRAEVAQIIAPPLGALSPIEKEG